MLTKLTIRNFKRFGAVEVELGDTVVLVGPNNSGKTSALQALALWEVGLRKWNEKRRSEPTPEKRPGVAINRRDLIAVPVPNANLLWRNLHVRDVRTVNGKPQTKNVRVDIVVEGVVEDAPWACGLEFDYANEESFYCRPLRLSEDKNPERMTVPEQAGNVQMAFLPPMSGLAASETRLDAGAVNVRIGEGRTAEVLRNLCYRVHTDNPERWKNLCEHMESLFGARLKLPQYIAERGEIVMAYQERASELDLSSSGRGVQQTLLLIAYMYAHPGAVLLLDEPDAHLEILRQRQIYQLLTDVARDNGNQIIAASHSEVVLNEAAERDLVIAFIGKPHRINDRGAQLRKALTDIGFEDYYLAEQTGWVLYLEGSTDLAVLRAFAERLGYREALRALERPFVHYAGNVLAEVRRHFYGLREAVPPLKGIALFDHLENLPDDLGAEGLTWRRREIENYLCDQETLEAYANASASAASAGPLFGASEAARRIAAMRESIREVELALQTLEKGSPWDPATKVSDDFLVPLFKAYFKKLGLPNVMEKKNFHELAHLVPVHKIDPEVREKLDAISRVADSASPAPELS
jgi:ABC-type taurine transport system ATPase subunit